MPEPLQPAEVEAYVDAVARHARAPIRVEGLTVYHASLVLSQLQLALRHPGNRGRVYRDTLVFARRLLDAVVTACGEDAAVRRGLEAGFDPQQDGPSPAP